MNRRNLLLLGAAAIAQPRLSHAQQGERIRRIGYLGTALSDATHAFLDEMRRLGYAENRNLQVLFRGFGEAPEQLPAMAAELVRAGLEVIVADGPEAPLRAARALTDNIPIVIVAVNYDPVERGYAASFARPGGNVTGVSLRSLEFVSKQVELLKELVPQATRLAVMFGTETEDEFAVAETSAKAHGLALRPFRIGDPPHDYDAMFRAVSEDGPPIVLVLSTPAFTTHRKEVAAAALRYRLPAMFRYRAYAEVGGLMSFGANNTAPRRRAAVYVSKILAGAKSANLPIQREDAFEFVINLDTAKKLGLTTPLPLLTRADEVVE